MSHRFPLYADHFAEPFLRSKGGQEHGQDRLSASGCDPDLTGRVELIWNKLNELLEHPQSMEMSIIETIQFLAMFIYIRVLSVYKAKEVSRHHFIPA